MRRRNGVADPVRRRVPELGAQRGRQTPATLALGQLGSALFAICAEGVKRREIGQCLGSDIGTRMIVTQVPPVANAEGRLCGAIMETPARSAQERARLHWRAVRHAMFEHDAGCFVLGVALAELGEAATRWGSASAGEYLMQGIQAVVAHAATAERASAEFVMESLELVLRERVTLTRPTMAQLAQLHSRGKRRGI